MGKIGKQVTLEKSHETVRIFLTHTQDINEDAERLLHWTIVQEIVVVDGREGFCVVALWSFALRWLSSRLRRCQDLALLLVRRPIGGLAFAVAVGHCLALRTTLQAWRGGFALGTAFIA